MPIGLEGTQREEGATPWSCPSLGVDFPDLFLLQLFIASADAQKATKKMKFFVILT
jgi:hypothetical protein